MKTIQQLREERAKLIESAASLCDAADDQERAMTDDEKEQADGFLEQAQEIAGQIEAAEADAAYKAAIRAEKERLAQPLPSPFVKMPQPTTMPPGAGVGERLTVPATVKRYGRIKNFTGPNADVQAYRFGQFCLATAGFERAKDYCRNYGIPLAAHTEKVNSQGGILVPDEFDSALIDLREQYGVARRLCRTVPMASDSKTRRRRTGGLTANFEGELDAGSESTKSWDFVTLTARKLMVLSTMSTELNEDAVLNVGDDLAGEISYAFANKEDDCWLNGTGTSTYGGILGIRTRLQDIDGAGTDSAGIATQDSGTTWAALALVDFEEAIGLLPQYADTPRTVWVCHKAFYANVMSRLAWAAGGNTTEHITAGIRKSFLGYPVEISQVMPSTTATTQICCLLGDFSLVSDFGDRRQTTIAFSSEATINSISMFESDGMAIRGTERFDINNHDCGSSAAAGPVIGVQTGS